jgi:hypothetical protein
MIQQSISRFSSVSARSGVCSLIFQFYDPFCPRASVRMCSSVWVALHWVALSFRYVILLNYIRTWARLMRHHQQSLESISFAHACSVDVLSPLSTQHIQRSKSETVTYWSLYTSQRSICISIGVWLVWLFILLFCHLPEMFIRIGKTNKQTPWSASASELYRPSDRRLSAKLVPTIADRGCHVVSLTDPCGRILGSLDRSNW